MSLSNDNDSTVTIDNGRALLSSTFLELCVKVRNSYPSILPAPGEPFKLRRMCEREGIELSNALLGNNSATYLHLETVKYMRALQKQWPSSMRTSKCLQRIRLNLDWMIDDRVLQRREEMLSCFLPAFQ
jgi:hypothetical protein